MPNVSYFVPVATGARTRRAKRVILGQRQDRSSRLGALIAFWCQKPLLPSFPAFAGNKVRLSSCLGRAGRRLCGTRPICCFRPFWPVVTLAASVRPSYPMVKSVLPSSPVVLSICQLGKRAAKRLGYSPALVLLWDNLGGPLPAPQSQPKEGLFVPYALESAPSGLAGAAERDGRYSFAMTPAPRALMLWVRASFAVLINVWLSEGGIGYGI